MVNIFSEAIISSEYQHLGSVEVQEDPPILLEEQVRMDGYQKGFQEGMSQAQQEHKGLCQQLNTLLSTITKSLAEARENNTADIAEIVLAIVQPFFINQQKDRSAIEGQVSALLRHVAETEKIRLSVHPSDFTILQGLELKHSGLTLHSDESLRLGGCVLHTEQGVFDASIESQIDRLKNILLQIRKRASHD